MNAPLPLPAGILIGDIAYNVYSKLDMNIEI
jgi:hypothetical protein